MWSARHHRISGVSQTENFMFRFRSVPVTICYYTFQM
jgi:hypothetical protein